MRVDFYLNSLINMTIVPLSEGSFTIDHTKAFVPFNKSTDDLQQRPTGSLLVERALHRFKINPELSLMIGDRDLS